MMGHAYPACDEKQLGTPSALLSIHRIHRISQVRLKWWRVPTLYVHTSCTVGVLSALPTKSVARHEI